MFIIEYFKPRPTPIYSFTVAEMDNIETSELPKLIIPNIELVGTPFDAGKAKAAMTRIQLVNECRNLIHEHHSKKWILSLLKKAENYIKQTETAWPDVVREIEGIAEGASIPFEYIAALMTQNNVVWETEQCTNLAFATTPEGPLWGGNADGCPFPLVEIRDVHGAYRNITCALGGINEHGLALGISGTSPGRAGGGIPPAFRLNVDHSVRSSEQLLHAARLILDRCKTVDEAIELLSTGHGNHILIDETGKCTVVERAGPWCYVLSRVRTRAIFAVTLPAPFG